MVDKRINMSETKEIKRSMYSYLYTDPYEPVVHGTFGVGQSETLYMFMIQNIKDFIAEIMAGSRGFGHTDYVINGSNGFGHPDYDGDNDIESESSINKEHSLTNSDTKWMEYYKERIQSPAEYMNLVPVFSELILIDKLLEDFPNESDQKIIDEYKKTVEDKNRLKTKHSRKEENNNQKKKSDMFYQRKGKHSRNVKFVKNLLTAT
ncbi:1243_t:CDS:2 [Racocetra persica]|uniref:1243_t:CDS:1 n=1 Tax=Racocetra persica TaxID=160502 RepID=A0ACA9L3V4_9GLOM|nr:1243_t:CDS:2 [Racocetra persica]